MARIGRKRSAGSHSELEHARSGKGIVVYHFSLAAFDGWDEYEKLCGANWRPNQGHHSAAHEFVVQIRDNGDIFLNADKVTEAIAGAVEETNRRRAKQIAFNEANGITTETVVKGVSDIAEFLSLEAPTVPGRRRRGARKVEELGREELEKLVIVLEEEMFLAAEELRFEYAAKLRDEIKELRRELQATAEAPA